MAVRRRPRPLLPHVFLVAALLSASQRPLLLAARTLPSSAANTDGVEDLESLLQLRGGKSGAQSIRAWDNVCGSFEASMAGEFHQPCFGPGGEVLFCCVSGSTGCSCPPWTITDYSSYGCFNHENGNTLNAVSGRECGYFLPADQSSRDTARGRSLVSITTTISVYRASDNVLLGYVRKSYDGQNSYTFGSLAQALSVSIPVVTNGTQVAITALNGPDAGHPYVGFVVGSASSNDMTTTSPVNVPYAYLSGTGFLGPNQPASGAIGHSIQALGYNGRAECSVWNLNAATGVLTTTWTNTDFSQVQTALAYDPSVDFLMLTGSLAKFTSTFPGEGAYLVTLKGNDGVMGINQG